MKLTTLDIAVNKLTKLENLDHLPNFDTFWANWNHFADTEENRAYLSKLKLKTIYFADNPMSMHNDYRTMLTTAIPTLTQIDGNVLRDGVPFYH